MGSGGTTGSCCGASRLVCSLLAWRVTAAWSLAQIFVAPLFSRCDNLFDVCANDVCFCDSAPAKFLSQLRTFLRQFGSQSNPLFESSLLLLCNALSVRTSLFSLSNEVALGTIFARVLAIFDEHSSIVSELCWPSLMFARDLSSGGVVGSLSIVPAPKRVSEFEGAGFAKSILLSVVSGVS